MMRAALFYVLPTDYCLLSSGRRRDLRGDALAVAHDFDLVLAAGLHRGERLRVVVDVLHVAAREPDYLVAGLEARGGRGRALAHGVELEPVGRVAVGGH